MSASLSPEIVGKLLYPALAFTALVISQLQTRTRLSRKKIGYFTLGIRYILPNKKTRVLKKYARVRKFRFNNRFLIRR